MHIKWKSLRWPAIVRHPFISLASSFHGFILDNVYVYLGPMWRKPLRFLCISVTCGCKWKVASMGKNMA